MMKTFGPSFVEELVAAGIAGLPFSWGADGSLFGTEALADDQRARLDAVIAAHDPTKDAVPSSVTPRQARLALLQQGLLTQVEAAVASAGGATQITWEYATAFERSDPMIAGIGQTLGLSSDQIDALFALAATL
jgi:hypothetical protein